MNDAIRDYLSSQGFSETFESRFWSKVNKFGTIPQQKPELGNCWEWTAHTRLGYGRIAKGSRKGRMFASHKASWIMEFGPVPKGMDVLHKCDNPKCVNPNHLWIGTHLENMRDMISKKRKRCARILSQSDYVFIYEMYKNGVDAKLIANLFKVKVSTVRVVYFKIRHKGIPNTFPELSPKTVPVTGSPSASPVIADSGD